jgi:hypothetical protein
MTVWGLAYISTYYAYLLYIIHLSDSPKVERLDPICKKLICNFLRGINVDHTVFALVL